MDVERYADYAGALVSLVVRALLPSPQSTL
jgi:hypothetical protein